MPFVADDDAISMNLSLIAAKRARYGRTGQRKENYLAANGHNVTLWLNKANLVADGKTLTMGVAPVSINIRTMAPIRFAVENLGCAVE